ncbi:coth protein-domain-containing protein [Parasitella parasitica]|nr:coth protein-domain-containing protein [Parasitella parasitica]
MKFLTISSSLFALSIASINFVTAADVTYSVVAFPEESTIVAVTIDNQNYPLKAGNLSSNLFTGVAPYAQEYHYTYLTSNGFVSEDVVRHLPDSATTTFNEFFNRSKTVYDIPPLPKAYDDIYPTLHSGMNNSNSISTIILNVDIESVNKILEKPEDDHKFAQVYNMSYISHDAVYNFQGAGIKNSGQSSKEYAKQSFKIKFNKFYNGTEDALFGRRGFKLRAQADEPTMMREKLMQDSLAAAGVATLSGNWVRLFVNNEAFGLYLMIDETFNGFTENMINGGVFSNATGATYKGNSLGHNHGEADFVYNGTEKSSYNFEEIYSLVDEGRDKSVTKDNFTAPLIDFMERLNKTVMATDAQNLGNITDLMDSANHTMIHTAMSFLSGSFDGYWFRGSNFYLNENLETKKWFLITYDFDDCLGNFFGELRKPWLMTTPYQNYTLPGVKRPLIDIFIKSPHYEPLFQDILKRLVKSFFNHRVMKARIDAWAEMLREDVIWDYALPRHSPGTAKHWGVTTFYNNMNTTVASRYGILEWIANRTESIAQQLDFKIDDDVSSTTLPSA